jgi:MFS transporter, DHA3 family, tetracycline resistance protein
MYYLWSIPWLIAIFFMDACAAVAAIGPMAVGLPLLARNIFHIGAQGYSLLLWSYGLGAIFGMLFPSIFSPHRRRGKFLCLVQFIEVPLLIGIALGSFPIVMLCLMSLGLLNGYLNVLFLSLLQANVPKRMLGRMMSFYVLASVGFAPLSLYASGLIANSASVQVLFLAASILTLLGATLGVLIPSLRRLD